MTETQMEFKRRLREQAEKLFSIARELEDMSNEASVQWAESETDSEGETFWNDMKNNLEGLISDLDDTYNSLDEVVDDEESMLHQHEEEEISDEEYKEFEELLKEIDEEDE